MVGIMKIIVTSFKRSHGRTVTLSPPTLQHHHQPTAPPETTGHSLASLGQSFVGSLLLSPGSWFTRFCLRPPRVCFQILCKFLWLYGGINGNLLQEDLCHTQNPCHCGSPLLTCTSTGDTQTQFCLSVCGVSGYLCAQDMFEPIKCLWKVWSLILNTILPLLPSCWGLTFALGE